MPKKHPVIQRLIPLALLGFLLGAPTTARSQPIYITFVWHMHQPIYWPGEDAVQTSNAGHYSYSVQTVHTDRAGPYTSWPRDAVGAARAAGLGRCGAQVSLTGSLMENLDAFESAGVAFSGWKAPWAEAAGWRTDGGNPALDLIGFGYFHPLMALVDPADVSLQIRIHRLALQRRFPALLPSLGLFPPETAFSERMIPALLDAGVQWVVVDNVHFDRTLPDYPYVKETNLIPPNPADQRSHATPSWVSLSDLWAPGQVSAPWGYQPHYATYTDPATGETSKIIVVPGARYEGNEDARGGFGALNYEAVLSQLEPYNTDADHPILVVLHHDGDNYGGGTDAYYHSNFQGFVSWLDANPSRFQCITIQDYLSLHPPAPTDVIHVEDGSWSGADNGDPEFQKWNGDPGTDGYSPDRQSWAVITAARNRLATATAVSGGMPTDDDVLDGTGDLGTGWRYMLMAEASDYWYWDGTEEWDSQPARASNLATDAVDGMLAGLGAESVPPTVYLPQREAYNPGGMEWGPEPEPEAVTFWTFAYDVSGLTRVELRYRFDADGVLGAGNLTYDGGTWCVEEMTGSAVESRTNPLPNHVATRYEVTVPDLGGFLVDYYVEAEDNQGNVTRTPIQHVVVEDGGSTGPTGAAVYAYPDAPTAHDVITVVADGPGAVHWGINSWTEPPAAYWPTGTTAFGDGQSVETPLSGPDAQGRYTAVLGPFDGATSVTALDWVIHYSNDTWSTPDHHLAVTAGSGDPSVQLVAPADGAAVQGTVTLVAAAGDDDGVPSVQFLLDSQPLGTMSQRPYELAWDTSAVSAGTHTLTARADDGQGHTAEDSVEVTVGGGTGPGECRVAGTDPDAGTTPGTDGGVTPGADGGVTPGTDGGTDPTDPGDGGGCGCRTSGSGAGAGVPLVLLLLLLWLRLRARPRREGRPRSARPRLLVTVAAAALGLAGLTACGPTGDDHRDASAHDGSFPRDGDATDLDAGESPDASVLPDAGSECVQSPEARTGTTVYLYDGQGGESADPITVGTVVTVSVEIEVTAAPTGNIGFLHLDLKNLEVDTDTFTLNGSALTVSSPFDGTIPLTLSAGAHEVIFEASVVSQSDTLEVDAGLGYGSSGACPIDRSHSLAVLQVLGGIVKGTSCYDLDQARSVQVSPYVPLQSTDQYEAENGDYTAVDIDQLVVGGPDCPGPGVLVHQISKCFLRQAGSTVSLSGAAYGGDPWFVDDLLLVEVLDENENVLAAVTTYQIANQVLGCCTSPPCTSQLAYVAGGPSVTIENGVQGGGNNGSIAAGALDLTDLLPPGNDPFFLRFTALDQGVQGALDRIFVNVEYP